MTTTAVVGTRATEAWRDFAGTGWRDHVDVRDFIQANYTPYEGDASFLTGPTDRTRAVWEKVSALFPEERSRGVLDVDAATSSTITSHAPGYIDRERELIVGLQTDVPGWTDDPEAVDGLADFVAGLDAVQRVDVLPFHKLGAAKYEALGIPFPLLADPVPDPGLIESVRERFRGRGVPAY